MTRDDSIFIFSLTENLVSKPHVQYLQNNIIITTAQLSSLLQTAEGIRKANHPDWLQLVGLLHDMGKIMFLWGTITDGQDGYSPNGKQW